MSMYSNGLQPALQNLLQSVVRFFHPRSSCTTHISVDVQRITLNVSCMMISGGRTKLDNILPCHWLYEWFSQFHSCGTYSVLSRSPSNVNFLLNIVCVTLVAKMLRQCRMWFGCRLVWHAAAATFGCSLTALFFQRLFQFRLDPPWSPRKRTFWYCWCENYYGLYALTEQC